MRTNVALQPADGFEANSLLVTGGAGFIGSNFIRWVLRNYPRVRVVNLDALTYAGNLESLSDVDAAHGQRGDRRYAFAHGDIRQNELVRELIYTHGVDAIVHFAAESHVDRSIVGPASFVDTNVSGTVAMLEACRAARETRRDALRFLHVSTDEVYGSLRADDPPFTEDTPLAPNSPYSASKAGSDCLVRAYHETFGLDCVITRCSNNFGPFQFPEKLIPLMITRALTDQSLPVYGDGLNVRDWLHVEDHAEAIWRVLSSGRSGRVYNIGGESEVANITIVRQLLSLLGKSESLIRFVPDRPGHDRRYAMNITRIRSELGWSPRHTFDDGLRETVRWYLNHRTWWSRVLSEAYRTANSVYLAGSSATA